jgi:hypothetical protein
VLLAGESKGADARYDAVVVALDEETGAEAWSAVMESPGDASVRVILDPSDGVVRAAGYSWNGADHDVVLWGLVAADGASAWTAVLDTGGDDILHAAAETPDGGAVLAGWSRASRTEPTRSLVAVVDASGELLWRGLGLNGSVALGVAAGAGLVFVAERSPGAGSDADIVVTARDAETGAVAWTAQRGGVGFDTPWDIAIAGDRVVVTGWSHPPVLDPGTFDLVVHAFEADDGDLAWSYAHPNLLLQDDRGHALATTDDRVFVVGVTQRSASWPSNLDILTIALDAATGQQAWLREFVGPRDDVAFAVATSGDEIVVGGSSQGPCGREDLPGALGGFEMNSPTEDLGPCRDLLALAYDAESGADRWAARVDAPGFG